MRKFTKKILSVALAATVSISSLYTTGDFAKAAESTSAEDYKAATLTVKFKPNASDQGTPKIYAYDREPGAKPGSGTSKHLTTNAADNNYVHMNKEADGTYSYNIDTRFGYAYVIIETENRRYPVKEDKNDNSYFIESSVMIDASKASDTTKVSPEPTTFSAVTGTATPTVKPTVTPTSTPNPTTKSVTVFFNRPKDWTGTPYLYEYHRPAGGNAKETFGAFPGTKMKQDTTAKSGNWYSYTFNINTADTTYIIFASYDEKNKKTIAQLPAYDSSINDNCYVLTGTSWFDGKASKPALTTTKPDTYDGVVPSVVPATTAPATTAPASATPTATPIAATIIETAKPVNGPHVTTNYGQKATFADGSDTVQDYLYVELNLAGGATSATYVLDDGLPETITKNSVIKVGEGKIANAPITLKVTSTDGTNTNTQTFTYTKLPNYNNTVKTVATAAIKKALSIVKAAATSQTYNVKFTAPKDWKGTVYAYAYYVANDSAKTLVEPLGKWPGAKATKNSDGTYSTAVKTEIGSAHVMFSNYENGKETSKVPTGNVKDDKGNEIKDDKGNPVPVDGYLVSANSSIDGTAGKVTADTSVTETPSLKAYFGAEKSAPQVNTTKQKISAVVKDASGTPHFTFYVNNDKLYEGTNNSVDWDPTQLKVAVYSLKVVIKDDKSTIELKKNYTITDSTGATPEPTATPIITPTATVPATATATAIATATATAEVSADPEATPTATAITTSDAPANPDVTATPDAIPTASADVSASPDVAPTATVVPTIAPTAVPPVTTGGSVLTQDQAPNAVASASSVTGSVTFAKLNKTAGEDVVIKVATSNKKKDAKYTYSYYVNSKAIASKTTKTSATWTTSKKGTYSIKVIVFENGEQACVISSSYTVKARVITIQSFKANKKSGQKKKTKITLTAKAKATKGKVSYKFAVQKKNGKIKTLKGFSAKKKYIWKPTQKGTYKLYVYVKNGKGVLVKKTLNFKIK